MPRPVGRPPDQTLAQLRAIITNPSTTDRELGFIEGQVAAMFAEREASNGEEPKPRRRSKPDDSAQPEITLRELVG